jgi:hypothetical protein
MPNKSQKGNQMTKTYTFIFDGNIFKAQDIGGGLCAMEQANNYFDLPQGAWFGDNNSDIIDKNDTFTWVKGNFFD